MYGYKCHFCGGLCDAGELENGACYECRVKDREKRELQAMQVRKEINQKMQAVYAQQPDGQMRMRYGR